MANIECSCLDAHRVDFRMSCSSECGCPDSGHLVLGPDADPEAVSPHWSGHVFGYHSFTAVPAGSVDSAWCVGWKRFGLRVEMVTIRVISWD